MFVKRKFFFPYSGSYGYKLIYVDEQYSRTYKSYFDEDTSGKLISYITSESEYCRALSETNFHKSLVMIKKN